jgi:hypothetical protein
MKSPDDVLEPMVTPIEVGLPPIQFRFEAVVTPAEDKLAVNKVIGGSIP